MTEYVPNGKECHLGHSPDWDYIHIITWGAPMQFRDVGLVRENNVQNFNPKRSQLTIDGYFVGKESVALRIYQKS